MGETDERDLNFVCAACHGNLVVVGTLPDGREIYNCDTCKENTVYECVKCHKPRNVDGVGRCFHCTMLLLDAAAISVDRVKTKESFQRRLFKGAEVEASAGGQSIHCKAWEVTLYVAGQLKNLCMLTLVEPDRDPKELMGMQFIAVVCGIQLTGKLNGIVASTNSVSGIIEGTQAVGDHD